MNDIQQYKKFQQDPLSFIETAWGLKPQEVKDEFKEEVGIFITNGLWNRIRKEHFKPFHQGNLTWQQWILFETVKRGLIGQAPKKISVVSGHGIGKSSSLSMLIIWYLTY